MPWTIPEGLGPYPSLARYWRARFGGRVQRVALDAGLGCPNRDGTRGTGGCVFCDPAAFSPAAGDRRPLCQQLTAGIERARRRGIERFAAYFQPGSNTYAPPEILRAAWDVPLPFAEVVALCVGTRPDCVPPGTLDLLAGYRGRFEVWLELGLQSAHDATLERLARGHTAAQFATACRAARARRLAVCAHVILGLPGESPAAERDTARFLADLGVAGVKLHQLSVVRGTPLERAWRAGKLPMLGEAEYVDRALAFLEQLPPTVVLHRLVGDTLGPHLLAPEFDKRWVLAGIHAGLERSG